MKKRIFGIDGTWLIRRAFHATNRCHVSGTFAKDDQPAVDLVQDPNIACVSFLQSVLKLIKEYDYQYKFVILFDRGTYRYRPKEEFTEYKATRSYDDSFQCCWDANTKIIPLLRNIGITTIQIGGLEADDLGYYYSYNSDECILHSSDHDWLTGTRPTTRILLAKPKPKPTVLITYEDLMIEHIKEPWDMVLHKSIVGDGSDNLAGVETGCATVAEAIEKYKVRDFSEEILGKLDRNVNLMRLDRILYDEEMHHAIKKQEAMTRVNPSKMQIIAEMSVLNEWPIYMLGVLGKYNRLNNSI